MTCVSYMVLHNSLLSDLNILHFSFCLSDPVETAFLKVIISPLIAKCNGLFLFLFFLDTAVSFDIAHVPSFLKFKFPVQNKVILKHVCPSTYTSLSVLFLFFWNLFSNKCKHKLLEFMKS